MDISAHRLMYDNIHDFKRTSAYVESEIKRLGVRHDSDELVPGAKGKRHSDMWVSMKSVSHFNLGIALELMLKMILILNNVEHRRSHSLVELHDLIPMKCQTQLESTYQECRNSFLDGRYELVAFINSATPDAKSPPPLENRDITTLRGFFGYFDEDVILWKERYSYEFINEGKWRHYIDDLSVFIGLIDNVMANVSR